MNNNFVIFGVLVLVLVGIVFALNDNSADQTSVNTKSSEISDINNDLSDDDVENVDNDHHLEGVEITKNSNSLTADFTSIGAMPLLGEGGAVGYGLITESGTDEVIVSTTHPGVLDSEMQEDASDPVWHNHIVKLGEVDMCGANPGVIDITFESPGDISVKERGLVMAKMPASFSGTHSLTNENISFAPGTSIQKVVQFYLEPKFSSESELQAVCVTNIEEVEFDLI